MAKNDCNACDRDLVWSYNFKNARPLIEKSEKCFQCNKVFKQELITKKEFLGDAFKDFDGYKQFHH